MVAPRRRGSSLRGLGLQPFLVGLTVIQFGITGISCIGLIFATLILTFILIFGMIDPSSGNAFPMALPLRQRVPHGAPAAATVGGRTVGR